MRNFSRSLVGLFALGVVCFAFGCSGSGNSSDSDQLDASSDDVGDGGADVWKDANGGKDAADTGIIDLDASVHHDTGISDACVTGKACGEGGICVGDICCAAAQACAEVCCEGEQICSFQKCVTPGKVCFDETDCDDDQFCELSLEGSAESDGGVPDGGNADGACQGGKVQVQGRCLPRPPVCSGSTEPDDDGPLTCLNECQWKPPHTLFDVEVKYSWGGEITTPWATDVMMSPIVIQLDDDDCDGKITSNDIPEIVFTTFLNTSYGAIGTVHAISVINGKVVEKWKRPGLIRASTQLAGGNFDGKPGNEIVGCGDSESKEVVALNGVDGTLLWKNTDGHGCTMPIIADLDGDGKPEVIVGTGILDGATGKLKTKLSGERWIAADLDGDGKQELVGPSVVVNWQGTVLANTEVKATHAAIADFDGDGTPEIVSMNPETHSMWVWSFDPKQASPKGVKWVRKEPVDINQDLNPNDCPVDSAGHTTGGGPVTIADFNSDGVPDVALAGGVGYVILDGKKLVDPNVDGKNIRLWTKRTQDCSSAQTGSSIFDFNGDGSPEVVYSDELMFRIYEGATGKVLYETCNSTGTLAEFPVVADVDNDGQADIIVVSNAYSGKVCQGGTMNSGIRIFGAKNGNWVRTRRVWNQHPYSITNVEEDGTIPKKPLQNWKQKGLNNFRQNKQPGGEFSAPDAVVSVQVACTPPAHLVATVRNIGEALLPAELTVTFYRGVSPSGVELGTVKTKVPLYSAQAQTVSLAIDANNTDILNGKVPVYAAVTVPEGVHECRIDNNESKTTYADCPGVK